MVKKCPECGISLENISLEGHALSHWPEVIPDLPQYQEAIKRKKQLLEGGIE